MESTLLHLDLNSFFASVEQATNPALRGRPIVVGGGIEKSSVVAAASYEAKAYGIKNGMPTWEAKKLCPHLTIVIGDMTKYLHTSKEITKMLTRYTDLVEVFSIDEAFLDVTKTKERFGGEIAIAKEIKGWIREKFNLTCNIGIGPNKLLAKLAGELKKPDALIILRRKDIPSKIENIEVSKLCGIGQKLEQYLAQMEIKTFGDLHRCPREKLVKRFGPATGEHLWCMGQGIDNSAVLPYYHEIDAKSMGHSYTLPKFTTDMDEVKSYLLRLSEQVGRRLRKENYRGNVVRVSLGFGNFQFWSKQKKIENYTNDGYQIYKVGERLIEEKRKTADGRPRQHCNSNHSTNNAIRFVGVSVFGLIHNLDQTSLLPEEESNKKILSALDKINDRYGEFTIQRAAIMN
ncbi:MAG: DNA polymerase IV, partial [Candidatus Margulisiibacteriota bacterium]